MSNLVWRFIEKVRKGPAPDSARHFVGLPVEYEYKQIPVEQTAIMDDREMADGRPAYAWWNEIQMLRRHETDLHLREAALLQNMKMLRIAEWALASDPLTTDVIVRVKMSKLCLVKDPESSWLNDPGQFCERILPKTDDKPANGRV